MLSDSDVIEQVKRLDANIEVIQPFENPLAYGLARIQAQIPDLTNGVDGTPTLEYASLRAAVAENDQVGAKAALRPLKDWLDQQPPYEVDASDEGIALVPCLLAKAPSVDGIEVKASRATSHAGGGGFDFKIAGTGLSADAKLTVAGVFEMTCAPGESLVLMAKLPVWWERRIDKKRDITWLHVEPLHKKETLDAGIYKVSALPSALLAQQMLVDTSNAGEKPLVVTKTYTVEANLGFSVGFKIAAIGLEATLSAKSENEVSVELEATLPRGQTYHINWLGAPPGVSVDLV